MRSFPSRSAALVVLSLERQYCGKHGGIQLHAG
jgi:hypothetical protein